jgi:hypothetical protein
MLPFLYHTAKVGGLRGARAEEYSQQECGGPRESLQRIKGMHGPPSLY